MELSIDEINNLTKNNDELMARNEELVQALEEIRDIAEPRFVNGLNEEADLCNLTLDRIQNKIKEVLQ